MELAGGFLIEFDECHGLSAEFITPDAETGIGTMERRRDHDGDSRGPVGPTGSIIGPPMPIGLYRGVSEPLTWKRSSTYLRVVQPVRNTVACGRNTAIPLPPTYGPPMDGVPEAPRDDRVAYGAYLAGPLGHCIECHTPMVQGRTDFDEPARRRRLRVPRSLGRLGLGQHHAARSRMASPATVTTISRRSSPEGCGPTAADHRARPWAIGFYRGVS